MGRPHHIHFRLSSIAVALVVASCAGGYEPDPDACALDDGIFPGERLGQWKGYADHVALVQVESVHGPDSNPSRTVEVVESYFSGRNAPPLPDQLEVSTRSYTLAGEQYVTPLIAFDDGSEETWITQTCSAPILIEDDRVAAPERLSDGYKPLREILAGRPVQDFRKLMEDAKVPRKVRRYLGLRPEERARKVYGR